MGLQANANGEVKFADRSMGSIALTLALIGFALVLSISGVMVLNEVVPPEDQLKTVEGKAEVTMTKQKGFGPDAVMKVGFTLGGVDFAYDDPDPNFTVVRDKLLSDTPIKIWYGSVKTIWGGENEYVHRIYKMTTKEEVLVSYEEGVSYAKSSARLIIAGSMIFYLMGGFCVWRVARGFMVAGPSSGGQGAKLDRSKIRIKRSDPE